MTGALEQAQKAGSQRGLTLCHQALGAVQYLLGEWDKSFISYKQSIDLARQVGSVFGETLGSQRLALLETKLGHYDEAHNRLLRAYKMARESDSSMVRLHSTGRVLSTLIQNRLEAGDITQAVDYVAEGWASQQEAGECISCDVLIYPGVVPLYLALGDLQQAKWACDKARETAASFGSRAWTAVALYLQGLLAKSTGDWTESLRYFNQALEMFDSFGQPYDAALSKEGLFDVNCQADSDLLDGQSASLLERATDVYARLGAVSDEKRARLKLDNFNATSNR